MFFHPKTVVATTALLYSTFVAAQLSNEQINAYFRGNLSSAAEIYSPSDANWATEIIQRWTVFPPSVPVYVAAIKPATVTDVSAIVST